MIIFKLKKTTNAMISSGLMVATLGISLVSCTSFCRPYTPRAQTNPGTMNNPVKNPIAKKNPCMPNPDSTNPCAVHFRASMRVNPTRIARPENYRPYRGNQADLLEYGKKLYNDTHLSTNGRSCQSCHQDSNLFQPTFAQPYPHFVTMAKEYAGLSKIELDEIIQLCMIVSMDTEPFMWNSRALAALAEYTAEIQQVLHKNPSVLKNPDE